MHIASIGIDLGKTKFHLVALGERNKILLRRKTSCRSAADHTFEWMEADPKEPGQKVQ